MTRLVLASGSPTRARMLEAAGLDFAIDPAAIDESGVKDSLRASGASAGEAAETLAELKAKQASRRHGEALVIGADQILVAGEAWFDKPVSGEEARAQLLRLRGRSHRLETSAVVVRGGERIWHHTEAAHLSMRPFSDLFLDAYLARAGEAVLGSVGAYQVEGLGIQLFSRITGDHFVILGLPLLPLLEFLRQHGVAVP